MPRQRIYDFFFGELDRLAPPSAAGRRRRWLLLWSACGFFAVSAGTALGIVVAFLSELPPTSELREYKPSLTTKVLDREGRPVAQLFEQQRELVRLAQVPRHLVQAFLALEDTRFYTHSGIDFRGIARALVMAAVHRKRIGATSTITQQLARNLFLTQERTLARKVKEALLSLQIERRFRKDEIFELYLNQIYFGYGAYGVEAAARTYFSKHTAELSLSECAILAGIPRSPNDFNPYASLEKALNRKSVVLERMRKLGFVEEADAAAALSDVPRLSRSAGTLAPYFVETVRQELDGRYGSNLVNRGGLSVKTTLDVRLQQAAQEAFDLGLADSESRLRSAGLIERVRGTVEPLQGALVCLDPKTGHILAMIGGRDFKRSPYNRAVQARRQPGSAFKPFVYATALENGFTPSDVILDSPMVFTDASGREWKPENFEGEFFGPTLLRDALTHSRNVCTVKLMSKLGAAPVAELVRRLGVDSPLRADLSLALGTSEVTLLELTQAFAVFACGGVRVPPLAVVEVRDSDGNVRESNASAGREVLSPATCYVLTDMLKQVVLRGTATTVRAAGFSRPCAGKTGTTTNFTDAWFVGYTPQLVAGVWLGFDNRKSMGRLMTGGASAAPIWAAFMRDAVRILDLVSRDFPVPERGVEMVEVDAKTGLRATDECPARAQVAFLTGTAPTRYWSEAQSGPELTVEEWGLDGAGTVPTAEATPTEGPPPTTPEGQDGAAASGATPGPPPTPTPTPEFRF